jgi:hypothetical protein
MSLTKLSLGGNYDVIYKLFLPRESFVRDISAGDGNIEKLKVHKIEIFFGFDFEICIISLLVMSKY